MGYGFIKDDETGKDVLFFLGSLDPDLLNKNDEMTFNIIDNSQGKRAANVKKPEKEYSVISRTV